MRFDPQDPIWPNRNRFVLSNAHARGPSNLKIVKRIIGAEMIANRHAVDDPSWRLAERSWKFFCLPNLSPDRS
jgi:hypothetical protein